jgi:succinate dehydrogenase/fumarate reductase flavoprotein subunit
MFGYLRTEVGDAVPARTLKEFCDGSVAMLAWLEGHGVPFEGSLCPDGSSIDGLYAAGRSAAGLCSRSYVSGLSLADCVFSGRRAGRHAARATAAARPGRQRG